MRGLTRVTGVVVALALLLSAVPAFAANVAIGGVDTGIDVDTLITASVTVLGASVLLLLGAGLGFLIIKMIFRKAGSYFGKT